MESIDNQYVYWNKVSETKKFTHPLVMEKFKSYLSKESQILDFGCGYGRTCYELNSAGYKNVLGVDSSNKMIERGLKNHSYLRMQTLKNDLSGLGKFDVIILFAVLTCIPTDDGQFKLIEQLSELLQPNGIIYISDYWLETNERNLKRYDEFEGKYGNYGVFELPDGAIVRHHSKEWIEQLTRGFETEELFDCELTTMNGNQSSCFQFIGRKK